MSRDGDPVRPALRDIDFLRSSVDWLWETDGALRISKLSGRIAAITGHAPLAFAGQPLGQLGRLAEGPLTRLPLPVRPFRDQLITIGTGTASRRHYRLSGTPLLGPDGKPVGYTGSAREIDHPPEADTGFLTGIGREFRDPLNTVIALAEAMGREEDGPLAARYAEYARDIVGAGRHLLSFVDGMLGPEEVRGAALEMATLDAGEMLARAIAIVGLAAEAKRIALELPAARRLSLVGDERGVCQILVNLIGNAIKFTPDGGRVAVGIAPIPASGQVEFAVRDSGPGIAKEDQERIFRRFERISGPGGGPMPDGAGLGLHISRELAEQMGGELLVESRPGQGARFALRLPAA